MQLRILCNQELKEPENLETQKELYFASAKALVLKGKLLDESIRIFSSIGCIEESNILQSIRSLLPIMQSRSTWKVLGKHLEGNQLWQRYLMILSRGVGQNILTRPSISELWPSQIHCINNGLLASKTSKIIKLPTSAGKTRIAEMSIIYTLASNPRAKCVYVAPYRALVYELEQVFLNLFNDLGLKVSSLIGSFESDDLELLLVNDADILVMTPEKLDLLNRAQPKFLEDVELFILDEGHIIDDNRRGIKFELLLTRLKRKLPNARFIFLSAVVSHETLEDFAHWFNTRENSIIDSDWRPSLQRYAVFYWKKTNGFVRYLTSDDNPLITEFVPGVIKQRPYVIKNLDTGRLNRRIFPDKTNKSQSAGRVSI